MSEPPGGSCDESIWKIIITKNHQKLPQLWRPIDFDLCRGPKSVGVRPAAPSAPSVWAGDLAGLLRNKEEK